MFYLDNLLVLVFLCFNFFYAVIVLGKKIISHYNRMMRMCCSRDYIVIEQPKPPREIT